MSFSRLAVSPPRPLWLDRSATVPEDVGPALGRVFWVFVLGLPLLGRLEGRTITPYPQHDHGKLSGGGHGSMFDTFSFTQPNGPSPQWRELPHLADRREPRGIREASEVAVSALADPSRPIRISGLVSPRGEAEEGSDIGCPFETGLVISRGDVRQGDDGANARNGHQPLREFTAARNLAQLIFHGIRRRAQSLVDRIEGVRHELNGQIALPCFDQLITEAAGAGQIGGSSSSGRRRP